MEEKEEYICYLKLREDNILEIEKPNQGEFFQINLNALDTIMVVKDNDYLTIVLNNQKQINVIPIESYDSIIRLLSDSKLFSTRLLKYKTETMVIKEESRNKPGDTLTKEDFDTKINEVDLFVNLNSPNVLSITYEDGNKPGDQNRVFVDIDKKGTMVVYQIRR